MKKNLKLVLALIVAVLMIVSAMAETVDPTTLIGGLKVNGELSISGLDDGDKVTLYQILKWDPANSILGDDNLPIGWVWGDDIKEGHTLNDADLKAITGTSDGAGQIDSVIAGKIASNVVSGKSSETVSGTEYTKTVEDAGLYMAIVDPKVAGTLYNPIFVAANWYADEEGADESNSIAIKTSDLTYYDKAMAKKSNIPLDKEAIPVSSGDGYSVTDTYNLNDDNPYTGDVGEVFEFKVTTTIPKFAANYTKPVFKLNDVLSEGLAYQTGSIKVFKVNDNDAAGATLTAGTDYTITKEAADNWTIVFNESYLKGESFPQAGQKIKVTYLAKVTSDAKKIVNPEKNDVDLIFSTTPDDSEGHGLLRDETNHFTFSIDADVEGGKDWEESSNEAIKVGVDKNGNVIVSTTTEYWGESEHGPLEGAEFKLYTKAACADEDIYKSDKYPNGCTVKSDASGRITILGLDEGTYWLKETTAPTGYIKAQDAVQVTITADISYNETVETEVDNNGETVEVTYKTNKLNGWTVDFGNGSSTTYTFNNDGEEPVVSRSVSSSDKELINTKGVELPSTGGMGTTIFYVGGSILVLAAAILLVTKRRMGVED